MPNDKTLPAGQDTLDQLIAALEVDVLELSECLVNPGWSLNLGSSEVAGIHYNLAGTGRLVLPDQQPIDLEPHTLVILPPKTPFRLEVSDPGSVGQPLREHDGADTATPVGGVNRYVAGDAAPHLVMICGNFRANYGSALDIFAPLSVPIVERFGASDRLDHKLRSAMTELLAQEAGAGSMATALLKQVIVSLIRRSVRSLDTWTERFSSLSDARIARALAEMVARPSKAHNIEELAGSAGMSRSAFMAKFKQLVGASPITVLRSLRMREAATILARDNVSLDQVAHDVGYASRSSFLRAFREAHGCDPSGYKAAI